MLNGSKVDRLGAALRATAESPILREARRTALQRSLWRSAKARAKILKREFSIALEDVVVPDTCPILGLSFFDLDRVSPALDRIDSSKGYVRGNILVISHRANTLKRDATLDELRLIAKYYIDR